MLFESSRPGAGALRSLCCQRQGAKQEENYSALGTPKQEEPRGFCPKQLQPQEPFTSCYLYSAVRSNIIQFTFI